MNTDIKYIKHITTCFILILLLLINKEQAFYLNIKIEKDKIISHIVLNKNKKVYITNEKIKNNEKILQINTLNNKSIKNNNLIFNKNFFIIKKYKKNILILDKKKFSKKYKKKILGQISSNIKVTNNEIFININDNQTLAFDIRKDQIKWQTLINLNSYNIHTKSTIIASNTKIYQIIPNEKIFILNKLTGEILANKNIKINDKKNNHIKTIKKSVINKNLIYICYKDGSFLTLNGTTGDKIWQKTKNNYKNFFIIKNKIIITKKNGNITILNNKTGDKILTNRSLYNKKINIKHINKKLNIAIIKEFSGITHIIDTKTGLIIYSFKIGENNIKYISKNDNLIGLKKNNLFKIKIYK